MTAGFTVIIPARLGSTRLPGKALLDIGGEPMIARVVRQATASEALRVAVATDDDGIAAAAEEAGAVACMTASSHESGTDRLQEAAHILGLGPDDVVVNVQGDEPLIPPAVIDQVAALLADSAAPMASLFEPLAEGEACDNPNIVKVVTNAAGEALYFSRAPIPFDRDGDGRDTGANRHLGIYSYRVSLLDDFVRWGPCALERTEKLEQLRVLWHGRGIRMAAAACDIPPGVDTEADLARVRARLEA